MHIYLLVSELSELPNVGGGFWTTELGLAGLVVTALVSLLAYVIITHNRREDKMDAGYKALIESMNKIQLEERREWYNKIDNISATLGESINRLSNKIENLISLIELDKRVIVTRSDDQSEKRFVHVDYFNKEKDNESYESSQSS